MSLTVSVDVKQHRTMHTHWSQFVPHMSTDIRGQEALHHHHLSFPDYPVKNMPQSADDLSSRSRANRLAGHVQISANLFWSTGQAELFAGHAPCVINVVATDLISVGHVPDVTTDLVLQVICRTL